MAKYIALLAILGLSACTTVPVRKNVAPPGRIILEVRETDGVSEEGMSAQCTNSIVISDTATGYVGLWTYWPCTWPDRHLFNQKPIRRQAPIPSAEMASLHSILDKIKLTGSKERPPPLDYTPWKRWTFCVPASGENICCTLLEEEWQKIDHAPELIELSKKLMELVSHSRSTT